MSHNPSASMKWKVGVDVGGTFTDVIAVRPATGEIRDGKVLSTPEQEIGLLAAIAGVGVELDQIDELVHGHTVGINALLSRAGAKTGLLVTAGHRDLLDIGRMDREFGESMYDPTWLRPHQVRPIVERALRRDISERIGEDGSVVRPLDDDSVVEAVRTLQERGVESVGICFLNSYVNDSHEARVAEIVRELAPEMYVQRSALYPTIKEHERTTTVALDAYVGPAVTNYLHRLQKILGSEGFTGSLWIMMMNGGAVTVDIAAKAPVFQLVSGPVGGVAGAVNLARSRGLANLITMDVGGTSTDVATIAGTETPLTDLWTLEHGLTLTMPVVDVGSVGSGAGSILATDHLGSLRVGPASAGSTPGPASYGRGGTEATLTDACVALGILQPDWFAGGHLRLDHDLAITALDRIGARIGLDALGAATAAYEVACQDIADKIRSISLYRGVDVRQFSVLAFGAAGPMLACRAAEVLGMDKVVVPPNPGQFSALGLLTSDLRLTAASSPMATLEESAADLFEKSFRQLEDSLRDSLEGQGIAGSAIEFERAYFAMYAGQTWDNRLVVPPQSPTVDAYAVGCFREQFNEFYLSSYGFAAQELPILVTTVEVTAVVRSTSVDIAGTAVERVARPDAVVRLPGAGTTGVPVRWREELTADPTPGPALIAEDYSTTVVLPGWSVSAEHQVLTLRKDAS